MRNGIVIILLALFGCVGTPQHHHPAWQDIQFRAIIEEPGGHRRFGFVSLSNGKAHFAAVGQEVEGCRLMEYDKMKNQLRLVDILTGEETVITLPRNTDAEQPSKGDLLPRADAAQETPQK